MIDSKRIVFLDQVFVRQPVFSSSAYRVEALRAALGLNVFKNALWLASPEFYRELDKKGFDFDLLNKKERLTALKFFNRMSFRSTPFGAFAGFGLATWLQGKPAKHGMNRKSWLHLLPSVKRELDLRDGSPMKAGALISVNPTLYKMNTGWRYSRYELADSGKLLFFIYMLEHNETDELLLACITGRTAAADELIRYLVDLTDCTPEEASAHLDYLLKEQVLLADSKVSLLLEVGNYKKLTLDYTEGLVLPAALGDKQTGSKGDFAQPSLYAGLETDGLTGLEEHWQQEIRATIRILDLLAPVPPKNALDKFSADFLLKFGDEKVPLLQALDPDLGIAFDGFQHAGDHELLKGLEFREAYQQAEQVLWTPVHQLFMRIWLQDRKRGDWDPVILTDHDLAGLPPSGLPLPPSLSVFCSTGDGKLILHNTGGATATALTGRFSAFSSDFGSFCSTVAAAETVANPDVLFAEILQFSHLKTDNINRRSPVYKFVIPLNCFPAPHSILPADLEVCIQAGEILLLHRVTGKRVIARLPTAFNYHHNDMPLFRFLCALQYKSVRANLDFDPQKLFPGMNFYPRIQYAQSVLSLARWHVSQPEIDELTVQPLSISRLHLFCRKRGIPVRIMAGRGDQQMVFDLSDDQEAHFFLEVLQDPANSVITEFIGNDTSGLKRGGDNFCSQFIVSLVNPDPVYFPPGRDLSRYSAVPDAPKRTDWIYIKIYTTDQSGEIILLDTLIPWIEQNKARISQWFFVRYYDPDSHLRVRFRVGSADVENIQYELQCLTGDIRQTGLVQKIYFDTYRPETGRYTAGLIEKVEDVFFRGSEDVVRYLELNRAGKGRTDPLWPVLHCYGMVTVFFDGNREQIVGLCKWVSAAFLAEHGGEKKLKTSMDGRFRDLRPGLTALIGKGGGEALSGLLESALRRLSAASAGLPFPVRQQLIADMVHMQVNRIFSSGQRRHEAFIWHCLLKLGMTALKQQMPDCR
ncbi:lantibiotic dehydratase [Mucilaginibacter gossypii]|uniref:Thiopeptide-type bacteriocin biosynthesis domain-containing protein n=1 Tax=Mucilaginibacter gossypii TaxID=551996 RepID=A0A1G8A4H3_9SPHI|nr:lantibiotic dehydratase [Mucilaginibacter gossypii]SDH15773.1 thiopeptide-type bacteriocin biosynthesis domain-containing protein [Mucilaginibacter gossypii]